MISKPANAQLADDSGIRTGLSKNDLLFEIMFKNRLRIVNAR